jgi:modification methylase
MTDNGVVPQIETSLSVAKTDFDFLSLAQAISAHISNELETAHSFEEVHEMHAKTGSVANFIRQSMKDRKLKLKASNELTFSRIEIERWLGAWLAENVGQGRPNEKQSHDATFILKNLGVTKSNSSRWQLERLVPGDDWLGYAKDIMEANETQLTSAAVINWGKQIKRNAKRPADNAKEKDIVLLPTHHKDCLYHDKWASAWVGDAADLFFIDNDTVDLAITSPPYNIGLKNGKGRILWGGVQYSNHKDRMPEEEYQEWQIACLNEIWRVVKPGGSLFYNHKIRNRKGVGIHPISWIAKSEWTFRQQITWDRGSTHNKEMSYFWPHDELIFWLTKGSKDVYLSPEGARMSTVWQFGFKTNTTHPAPFPGTLPSRCIKAASKEGDLVLDPFGGSMTTCLEAKKLKRRSIGVDISEAYVLKYSQYLTQEMLL